MLARRRYHSKIPTSISAYAGSASRYARRPTAVGKRSRGGERRLKNAPVPPETWHEPLEVPGSDYRIVVQDPGPGYRHVVTPQEVRARLKELPLGMTRGLEVVQFSRMTKKKTTFPCYGMQWGQAIYLYPVESSLIENYHRPPLPAEYHEARMYGGRWEAESETSWKLIWSEESIRNFYLNNILLHELGHLLDDRNTTYRDRERYANWFAIEYGYKRGGSQLARRASDSARC